MADKQNIISRYARLFKSLVRLYGYLKGIGWVSSAMTMNNVNPWFTYPFIKFLRPRLRKEMFVFEYGSGVSTEWFKSRVGKIVSVEHNIRWAKGDVIWLDFPEYQNEILNHWNIDIVVIDGRKRIECAKNALQSLSKSGVIIWDNSDRIKYQEGYDFLTDNGFKRIDFWGLGDVNSTEWCTSVFYRNNNCLGL